MVIGYRIKFGLVAVMLACWVGTADAQTIGMTEDYYPAFLQAQRVAVLSSVVEGVIEHIAYEPQEFADKGAVLVQLDAKRVALKLDKLNAQIELNTAIQDADIRLKYAEENLAVAKELYGKQIGGFSVGTKKALNEAEERRDIAKLDRIKAELEVRLLGLTLDENQEIVDLHSIKAPWSGVVVPFSSVGTLGDRNLKKPEAGETVRAGQELVAMMKVDRLRVSTSLPVAQLKDVHLGQTARVYVPEIADEAIPATVVFKSPTVDFATTNFEIEVELQNVLLDQGNKPKGAYRYKLRPGMRARVDLANDDSEVEVGK